MFSQACVKNSVHGGTATAADGTHPAGMHSCIINNISLLEEAYCVVTARQRSCGKVMFSVVFLCLFIPYIGLWPWHFPPSHRALLNYEARTIGERQFGIRLKCLLVTARKRSLGQGMCFYISVILSTGVGEGGLPVRPPPPSTVKSILLECIPVLNYNWSSNQVILYKTYLGKLVRCYFTSFVFVSSLK